MIGMSSTAPQLTREFKVAAARVPAARRALLRILAIDTEREANKLASGGGKPGSYPIPSRTGFFSRSFGFELHARRAIVFSAARYAEALHNGFNPYGNPDAMPIRPRPFFDDAIGKLDMDRALRAWEGGLE